MSGEVLIQAEYDDGDPVMARTRILRADPRVRIAAEFVINVDETRPACIEFTAPGVLVISDSYGQRFTYRIDFDDYDPQTRSYGMEWPD